MFGFKKKVPSGCSALPNDSDSGIGELRKQVSDLTKAVSELTVLLSSGKLEVRKVRRIKMKVKKAAKASVPAVPAADTAKEYHEAGKLIDTHNEVLAKMKDFVKTCGNNTGRGRGEVKHLVDGKPTIIALSSVEDIKNVIQRAEAGEITLTN